MPTFAWPLAPRMRALIAVLGFMFTMSCAHVEKMKPAYEYRYRVFESKEKVVAPVYAPIVSDANLQKFMPAGALNAAMDTLGQEGFALYKVEPVPGSSYYTFTFRRALAAGYRPTRAPMEFQGVYQAQAPADAGTFYVFTPRFKGYQVFIFSNGNPVPKQLLTDWDPKTQDLHVQDGPVDHSFKLSVDGLTVGHVSQQLDGNRLKREIVTMLRIQNGD